MAVEEPAGTNWWNRIRTNTGFEAQEDEPQTLLQQLDEATTLSRMQRIYGFAICLGIGLAFGFLASLFLLLPVKFAILYTVSNIFSIGSTMFLMGPMKQLGKMFDKGRIVATCTYLASLGLTLWAALWLHNIVLTIVFLAVQFCALVWYCLSYIPYARQVATSMGRSVFGE